MNKFKIGSLVRVAPSLRTTRAFALGFFFVAGEDPFGPSCWMEEDTVFLYLGSLDQNDYTHSSPYSKVLFEDRVILVKTGEITYL